MIFATLFLAAALLGALYGWSEAARIACERLAECRQLAAQNAQLRGELRAALDALHRAPPPATTQTRQQTRRQPARRQRRW